MAYQANGPYATFRHHPARSGWSMYACTWRWSVTGIFGSLNGLLMNPMLKWDKSCTSEDVPGVGALTEGEGGTVTGDIWLRRRCAMRWTAMSSGRSVVDWELFQCANVTRWVATRDTHERVDSGHVHAA